MTTAVKRSTAILCWLSLSVFLPAKDVGAASYPPLTHGWSMIAMPSRSGPGGNIGPAVQGYGPRWLLATRRRLITIGSPSDRGPHQPPNEWISPNGRAWRRITLSTSLFGKDVVNAVAAGQSGLVAVGLQSPAPFTFTNQPAAWFSPDGRTWRRAAPIGNAFGEGEMNAVTAVGRGFVAVGDIEVPPKAHEAPTFRMAVWTSPGGGRWRLVSDRSPVFQNAIASVVLRTGSGLVALGRPDSPFAPTTGVKFPAALVWTSRDGRTWRRVPQAPGVFPAASDLEAQVQGAVKGNGRYVAWAISYAGVAHNLVWMSADGLHWRREPGIHFQYGTVSSIVPHGAGFVAVGERDAEPTLWSSRDGIHWAPVVGEDVFGPGGTSLGSAADWNGRMVVVGSFNPPVPINPSPPNGAVVNGPTYTPTAWIWRPGGPNQRHPAWSRTDPKWFRLRVDDLPPRFAPSIFGPSAYGIGCVVIPDFERQQIWEPVPPTAPAQPCKKAAAALGVNLPYFFKFQYGGSQPGNGPYVAGFAILAQDPAHARAAFQYARGLVTAVDLNENITQPKPIRSLPIGQGAELFSLRTWHLDTAYAVVWWDGRALGVVDVAGVPLDREALAVRLAQRQWARRHSLGF